MSTCQRVGFALTLLVTVGSYGTAAEVYVSPTGRDDANGTLERPFATIQRAQAAVGPGDTVFVRGGTYKMTESGIARKHRIWAYVTELSKNGERGKPIRYFAYKDERPVFDLSAVKPDGLRVDAFFVSGSWVHLRGFEVVGVQVTAKGHTQSIGFENAGSHNVYERLTVRDGQAIGFYVTRGSDNLVLNCDAHNNHDATSEDGKGGNVDGFGCHPPKGGTGNVFRGCRAWLNSDDGFDCINAHEPVVFEHCWAFRNGYSAKGDRLADGNGFKAGGYGSTPAARLPDPIPRHVVRFCLAVGNKNSGFYANHHPGGCDWVNNTASRNGADFNMLGRKADNTTDVDGYGHKLVNNLIYPPRRGVVRMDATKCERAGNSFDLDLKLADKHFLNLDEAELTRARQANGGLPEIDLLRPVAGSPLVGAGTDAPAKGGEKPNVGALGPKP
ncbi:right-handed parallel beta-helix repeat-containing protein [Gemmata sp. JC717]|uniref:right-handed parallel beta-helix repeat-containing protein n=1 Tax=Gemmata algarum TaxID=2975278 RepID=UPI0021BA90DB|nr:right-handed parallel beta-helix repeat-containing protein [Gemmata algarum]MDY3556913.1 right-handed parallel beta-helix repeat-containing protein [Gemmata algarum]